jgi:hypothetical protein
MNGDVSVHNSNDNPRPTLIPAQTTFDVELTEGQQPIPWVALTEANVKQYRYLYCSRYNDCLTFAAGHGWVSFACIICPYWPKKLRPKS